MFAQTRDVDLQIAEAPPAFLIGGVKAYLFKNGKLVWLDTKASTDKQAQDLLEVLATR